jgi:thymidine phosphorylase
VSAGAGVICLRKPGDEVAKGEPVLELRTDDPSRFGHAIEALSDALEIAGEAPEPRAMVIERIRA